MADEQQRYFMGLSDVSNWPLIIDDASGVSYHYIARKAKKWKRKNDIQLLVIDYLQLMKLPKGNQNDAAKWGDITKNLKALAKELNIPIILLSQLNRAVETRGGSKRPQLSDLRESGAIEQDADQVLFMYRPEYYQILEDEEGESLKGIVEIIYGKNRDGKPETLKAFFNAEMIDITDIGGQYSASKAKTGIQEQMPIIKPQKTDDDIEIPF
jgi:replicative DNA helicase